MQTQTPTPTTPRTADPLAPREAERVTATEMPAPVRLAPAVDVLESAEALRLVFDVPGVDREDAVLEVDHETLRLEATQRHGVGRRPVRFERTLGLPTTVDTGRVEADLARGVLTVTLPKRDEVKPRTIPVGRGA